MGEERIPIGRVMEKLDAFYAVNDTQGAERHLLYWINEAEALRDRRGMLTLYNELMGYYRKAGNGEKALFSAGTVLRLLEEEGITDTLSGGTFLVNCATVYTAFHQPVQALALFDKAKACYEKELTAPDTRLGSLYNNMALGLLDAREYEGAKKYFRLALGVMEQLPGTEPEQAVTWLNLATAEEAKEGLEQGMESIEIYLKKAGDLLDFPGQKKNGNYAFVCSKCAPIFEYYGYFGYAKELTERAKTIYEGT